MQPFFLQSLNLVVDYFTIDTSEAHNLFLCVAKKCLAFLTVSRKSTDDNKKDLKEKYEINHFLQLSFKYSGQVLILKSIIDPDNSWHSMNCL